MPTTIKAHLQQGGTHAHKAHSGTPGTGDQGDCPLDHTDHLLHMDTQLRLGDIEDLPNTEKRTERDTQNVKTNMSQMKNKTKQNRRKVQKNNSIKWRQATYQIEFKTLIKRMLNELNGEIDEHSENFNKKAASAKKDIEKRAQKRSSQK